MLQWCFYSQDSNEVPRAFNSRAVALARVPHTAFQLESQNSNSLLLYFFTNFYALCNIYRYIYHLPRPGASRIAECNHDCYFLKFSWRSRLETSSISVSLCLKGGANSKWTHNEDTDGKWNWILPLTKLLVPLLTRIYHTQLLTWSRRARSKVLSCRCNVFEGGSTSASLCSKQLTTA